MNGAISIKRNALKGKSATDDGRLRIDGFLLKVPVLGDMLRKSTVSRVTRTLGTMISSGVSILDGLEITARTSGSRVIQNAIMASPAARASLAVKRSRRRCRCAGSIVTVSHTPSSGVESPAEMWGFLLHGQTVFATRSESRRPPGLSRHRHTIASVNG